MQAYQTQTRDTVERIGILIWKIAVLVIGLHCTLLMIPQQGLLDGLVIGSTLLQASALVLLPLGLIWAVVTYGRVSWSGAGRFWRGLFSARLRQRLPNATTYAARRRSAAQRDPRLVSRASAWMLVLGLEGMLAAQIIQVSMAYVGKNELSWSRIGVLAIVAVCRILI